jgi:peptidoglycan-N-acetylglucosamine deacetylase
MRGRSISGPAVALAAAGLLTCVWFAPIGGTSRHVSAAVRKQPGTTRAALPHRGTLPAKVSSEITHAAESGGKAINITIDDGPDPIWTPKILQVLHDDGVHATFCMIGPHAAASSAVVKKIVADGDRLCDHTVSHDMRMNHRSDAYQKSQILDAERMIQQASGGVAPMYYRAPGGAFTPYSRQVAASHGMRPLGWNIDSKDFYRPGVNSIVNTVKYELRNGPTILFHDGGGNRSQTYEALKRLLPWLKAQGYTFSFPLR